MKKHAESHFDHGLTKAQVDFLMKQFADKAAFFIATIELPESLGTVPCGLFGPLMGDAPIPDGDVTHAPRGKRAWTSRLIDRAPRPSRLVTVIAGPHEEPCWHCDGSGGLGAWKARIPCETCDHGKVKHPCIVYTMFGGPLTPQEPGDPGCKDLAASTAFWREHALAR